MSLRMRQICLVARHLAPVVEELCGVLGLEVCHRDPGVGKYGLENALFPIGHNFLEVVAPVREGTTAGRYLDRRGGDGGYMVITQCDDLVPRRKRCEALGVRIANEIGHPEYRELQLHPRDVGAAMLSFGWQEGARSPGGPWHPAAWRGEPWPDEVSRGRARSAVAGRGQPKANRADLAIGPSGSGNRAERIRQSSRAETANAPSEDTRPAANRSSPILTMTAAELQSEDPDRLARRWSLVMERPIQMRDGQRVIALDDATLRFIEAADGRGEGLGGLDLACADPARAGLVQLCGIRFRLI